MANIKIQRVDPMGIDVRMGLLPAADLGRWASKNRWAAILAKTRQTPFQKSTMSPDRLFKVIEFLQAAYGEPIRSVITDSCDAAVFAWYVKPGQRISAYVHLDGQDPWTILSGCGEYRVSAIAESIAIAKGDMLVANRGEVHGVLNTRQEPLVFVSVVSPAASGFEPA